MMSYFQQKSGNPSLAPRMYSDPNRYLRKAGQRKTSEQVGVSVYEDQEAITILDQRNRNRAMVNRVATSNTP